ncbi:MAG TPA: M20 family metallo-hydrolase [Bacillales bacterium]|nr:M20 family metallo-hydrolase [Bacillales bacterium]
MLLDYDHSLSHSGISGDRLAFRLNALAQIGPTREQGSLRIGFSPEERQAKDLVKVWLQDAGLEVKEDGAGNVFGRLSGTEDTLSAILSGSHVDTVLNGGHFDGTLGVLSALEVVEAWKENGYRPKRPFELVIFSDEEGSRFNGGLIGSEAMVGDLDLEHQKQLKDIDGVPFEKVMEQNGLSLKSLSESKRDLREIEAFVEVHIEQGKRLEKAEAPVGIVTGIAGPCWIEVVFEGVAGHAGNTPMDDRHDALVAAGYFIADIERLPRSVSSSAVATVGKMHVSPNGVNVIPGKVELFVDVRDIYEDTRDELVGLIIDKAKEISEKCDVRVKYKNTLSVEPVVIQKKMQEKLARSVKKLGLPELYLPSGAGHDAMIIGHHLPVAMLFVQSKDGISHSPKEWSSLNDCVRGVHVLKDFLESLLDEN